MKMDKSYKMCQQKNVKVCRGFMIILFSAYCI